MQYSAYRACSNITLYIFDALPFNHAFGISNPIEPTMHNAFHLETLSKFSTVFITLLKATMAKSTRFNPRVCLIQSRACFSNSGRIFSAQAIASACVEWPIQTGITACSFGSSNVIAATVRKSGGGIQAGGTISVTDRGSHIFLKSVTTHPMWIERQRTPTRKPQRQSEIYLSLARVGQAARE